ncbi:oxidoreductase [Agrilactobacillus composti DSM 18527 = JCM 14202]|uniref:Oxidoreductase n=1 Tax=Agrilactobacillus composti DSM 18527 = JCM 14202 TaxID=1423734 RepID=X0PTY4_9LACO|nr:aldo/keto reductase [Agrilactobacillus composti]KRM30887.1 oxidoreductase [Agrilactobacillus composti DSM 18527 = JCM 14202]GAF40821.1 oxidoreductase [Agrilactobacillus composti DSM 18527 = JCM 14202]
MIDFKLAHTVTFNDGRKIPQMGLGVWKEDNAAAKRSVEQALHAGYKMIDTAKQYGNEAGVGAGLKSGLKANNLQRSDIFVTTKIFNGDQGYQSTLDNFKKSLQHLQLDYVDLLLIHWPVDHKYKDTWRALEELQRQGLAKSIGVSNFDEARLKDLLSDAKVIPVVNQLEFNPLNQQQKIRTMMADLNIRLEAWSPLGGGAALNNPVIVQLAQKYQKTPAQIILRWDIQQLVITIPKSTHEKRMVENSEIDDFKLTDADMKAIAALDQEKKSLWYDDFKWHNPNIPEYDTVHSWPDSPKD